MLPTPRGPPLALSSAHAQTPRRLPSRPRGPQLLHHLEPQLIPCSWHGSQRNAPVSSSPSRRIPLLPSVTARPASQPPSAQRISNRRLTSSPQRPEAEAAPSPSAPGFLFTACMHYGPVAPVNLEPIVYPSSVQTTYPCLCKGCDFGRCLSEGASIRQLWFDIAVPRYNYLISLGESTVRPRRRGAHAGAEDGGWSPQPRSEYRWVEPVLEEAKKVRAEQGRIVVRFVGELVREFGARWGGGEEEKLRAALGFVGRAG